MKHARFATHYKQHVIPQLQRLAKAEAACVVAGCETLTSAYAVVMRHAIQLGALFLSEEVLQDLEDWTLNTIVEYIDASDEELGCQG